MLAVMADAIATGQVQARDILAAVTPGGSKSLLPVLTASQLITAGLVDRVCWVVPRDSVRLQAEEALADPTFEFEQGGLPLGPPRRGWTWKPCRRRVITGRSRSTTGSQKL